jgi:hypothetical protein
MRGAGTPTIMRSDVASPCGPDRINSVATGGGPELEAALERLSAQIAVDGLPVTAFAGETVATVLFAEDIVMPRRMQRGSPRGVFHG